MRGDGADKPGAAHVFQRWLPRTLPAIFNLLRHQRAFTPIVFAEETENLDEFPLEPIVVLKSDGLPRPMRALRRARAYASRLPTTYDERLVRFSRRHGCALTHAHFGHMGWRALPARRRLGTPLLADFYGADLAFGRDDPVWRARYRDLFAEGTFFLCEGPAMGEHLVALGAPHERIRVAKLCVDLEKLPFRPRSRAERPWVILQTARLVPKKGIDISIRAFATARGELGDAELWIVGDGPEREALTSLATELGLGASVRFLGSLSYDDYRDAMARAQVGIQPSRVAPDGDTEGGAPTVLLDMQASGMPVVATRHADIPQVVPAPEELAAEEDVEAVAAAMVGLLGQPEGRWRERIQAGRALIEREHDADAVAVSVEGIYAEAIERES